MMDSPGGQKCPVASVRQNVGEWGDFPTFWRNVVTRECLISALAGNILYAKTPVTIFPPTSVRLSSRPWWKYVNRSWSSPIRCKIVA